MAVKKKRNIRKEYKRILLRLIEVIKLVSAKYTRSKVRKALPNDYRYILDELINMPEHSIVKSEYYDNILEGILSLGNADKFIVAMCDVISRYFISLRRAYSQRRGVDFAFDGRVYAKQTITRTYAFFAFAR